MGDETVVVKDCSCMHPFLKRLMGQRTQKREVAVYHRLAGVSGIPSFKGVIDKDAFAVEFVAGETLSRAMGQERLGPILENLNKVISGIHERRVVHLDLKQKRNVLVLPDNGVYVVDFQSALCFPEGRLAGLIFSFLRKRDRAGLIKFKGKYAHELLSQTEKDIFRKELFLAHFWPFTAWIRQVRKLFKPETENTD
jgi:RIO-like serine/threonine protein kinase